MKRALALTLFSTASIISTYASAGLDICLDAYAGVDAQIRRMHFQKNFGGNVLQHRYPQANVFAGVKFNDYVGIEAGYEFTKKQRSTRTHRVGEVVFGELIPPNDPIFLSVTHTSRASSKLNGANVNLVMFLPFCEQYNTQFIGSMGMAYLKSRVRNIFTTTSVSAEFDDAGDLIGTTTVADAVTHDYKKRKYVPRISAGLQHITDCCVGIRLLATWENTAKLKNHGKDALTGTRHPDDISKPDKSWQIGLGVFTPF